MTDVPAGNDFVAVAGTEDVGLALRANGTVVAWGGSEYNLVAGAPVTDGISSIYSMYYSFASLSGEDKKTSSEAKCQKALAIATGKYQLCMEKEQGKLYGGGGYPKFLEKSGKCIDKYVEIWPKLVKKYAGKGTSCEGDRYLENGDGTFYDRLTQLTWEQKDDSDGIHDKDNVYTWTLGDRIDLKENGSAFTDFLAELNKDEEGPEPGGLTDSRGWRIPSVNELATLVEPGYPNCAASPCTTVPGETAEALYGSSSTYPTLPNVVWGLNFSDGGAGSINKYDSFAVRAVRGGS